MPAIVLEGLQRVSTSWLLSGLFRYQKIPQTIPVIERFFQS